MLGSVNITQVISAPQGQPQQARTVDGSLQTSKDPVDLLAGLVGGVTNDKVVNTKVQKVEGVNLLAGTRGCGVEVTVLDFVNDLTRTFLGFFGGIGVVDVGLGSFMNQSNHTVHEHHIQPPCGHR